MKRCLQLLILLIIFMPTIVYAETCDSDRISISSITVDNKSDNVEEIDTATASDKKLTLNLSMSEVGDNIKYRIIVKNNSNEDYELDKSNFGISSDYVNYSLESDNNSNIVKANSSKTVYLKIEYKNEVPEDAFDDDSYNDNKTIVLNLSSENIINNPKTGVSYLFLITLLLITISTIVIVLKRKKYNKLMIFIIGLAVFIPISVYAICKVQITLESSVIINNNIDNRKCLIISGDGNNIGDEVDCAKERFQIAGFDNDNVLLFAKYNLLVGNTCSSSTSCTAIPTNTKGYGLQSNTALGWDFHSYPTIGTIAFSESVYWLGSNHKFIYPYGSETDTLARIYDSNSIIYTYVENYKNLLIRKGIDVIDTKLFNWTEYASFRDETGESLRTTSWLDTANTDSRGILSTTGGGMYAYNNNYSVGIRPVIIVNRSIIQ